MPEKCNDHSLRLRLKSQISQNKLSSSKQSKCMFRNQSKIMKEAPADLTCRILKWNNLKNKGENRTSNNFNQLSIKRRNSNI